MTSKSDDTKAEITISTISPEDAKTRRTDLPESQAINLLRNRFYITGHASGQPKFYDTLNDIGNQLTMHLIPVVLQEIPELSHDYDTVKGLINRLVNDGVIRPLSLVMHLVSYYYRHRWHRLCLWWQRRGHHS